MLVVYLWCSQFCQFFSDIVVIILPSTCRYSTLSFCIINETNNLFINSAKIHYFKTPNFLSNIINNILLSVTMIQNHTTLPYTTHHNFNDMTALNSNEELMWYTSYCTKKSVWTECAVVVAFWDFPLVMCVCLFGWIWVCIGYNVYILYAWSLRSMLNNTSNLSV